jgi:hypothetical protein
VRQTVSIDSLGVSREHGRRHRPTGVRAQKGYNFNDNPRRRSKLVVFFDLEGVTSERFGHQNGREQVTTGWN